MNDPHLYQSIAARGICKELFDEPLGSFVLTTIKEDEILQQGTVKGVSYRLTIRLVRWTGRTTPQQIAMLSRLFFEVYPKMHERFGKAGESPTDITLDIENRGYGIAWNAGSLVHLHDGWLEKCPEDFDCITHELAHAIQNGWAGETLEYDSYIERFADACRYLYAFEDGKYNDVHWQLQTIEEEATRKDSVRFLVWLDHFYSTRENDLLLNYFKVCRGGKYPAADWKRAWDEIFCGSALAGCDIDDVFMQYANSPFARLSTKKEGGTSPMLAAHDLRKSTRSP